MGKVIRSFRLSEEAVEILNKQDNATEFVERLILSRPKPTEEYIISVLEKLEKRLEASEPRLNTPTPKNNIDPRVEAGESRVEASEPLESPEHPRSVITRLEAERDEELAYVQDDSEIQRIGNKYQKLIEAQWDKLRETGAI